MNLHRKNSHDVVGIILFDLGGVLVEWNGSEELPKLVGGSFSKEDATQFWLHSSAVRRFESGLSTAEEFGEEAVAELHLDILPQEWLRLFISWDRGPLVGAKELLAELSVHHELGCLSNNNELHWNRVCDLHRFDQFFGCQYLSHEIGLCKPDPALFQYVLADLQLSPSTVLYLDDNREIVEAAKELGIRAFQARGIDEARAVLRSERRI
jgi:putative hydrolase of the HAD superfamily